MATRVKTNTKSENRLQQIALGMRLVYVPLVFAALYLTASGVYLISPTDLWYNNVLAFLTSPFNFKEDFLKTYSSVTQGIWLNLVFTFAIIAFSIFYFRMLAVSKRISPTLIFWTSVLASYVVAGAIWLLKGVPSTGTSIIGFCITAFLIGSSFKDLSSFSLNKKEKINRKHFLAALSILFFSLVLSGFYLLGGAAPLHLLGGTVCAGSILVVFSTRKPIL